MKKLILTIAIFILSLTNGIANETIPTVAKDQIVQIFDWNVKTTQGNYSGTANSLEEANKIIILVSTNEVILEKKIESFYQIKNQENASTNRLYFWEAHTASGYAKGFSNSENQAKKMIEIIANGAVLNYKIIQSSQY